MTGVVFILLFKYVYFHDWSQKQFDSEMECQAYRYELSQQRLYEYSECIRQSDI